MGKPEVFYPGSPKGRHPEDDPENYICKEFNEDIELYFYLLKLFALKYSKSLFDFVKNGMTGIVLFPSVQSWTRWCRSQK